MEMIETFTVPVSPERLWETLIDVERVAPCVPGFQLQEINDPDVNGSMKVKVGAITVQYDAVITFLERDEANRRAVIKITGRERRGAGSVDATTTVKISGNDQESAAEIATDVAITGKVAQFGRGVIGDVNKRLMEQFVDCLNRRVLAPEEVDTGDSTPTATADTTAAESPRVTTPPVYSAPLDLGALAGPALIKRVAPLLGVLLVVMGVVMYRRRRPGRSY